MSRIVEDRDADAAAKAIHEINVGTYVVEGDFLFSALERLQPSNAQGEFYLTDIVQMAVEQGAEWRRFGSRIRMKASASTHGANWPRPNRLFGGRFVIVGSMPEYG